MQSYVGEDFDAVISGVASFGFWAETVEQKCEGMVSIADLAEFDDFEMLEHEYALVGRNTGLRFRMGDKVRVRVVSANLDKRQIDYTILELPVQRKRSPVDTEAGKKPYQVKPPKSARPKKNPAAKSVPQKRKKK